MVGQNLKNQLNVDRIRADFPTLHQDINGHPLVYLDNASSAQKPQAVIDATSHFYAQDYSNVHRGVHTLSQRSTDLFEATREKVRRVLNASHTDEIIFTKGCTEGINLVAQSWARNHLKPGDEILLTEMEHHSNIVPWQMVAEQTGAKVVRCPITDAGEINLDVYRSLINERTKIAAMVHISNSIGTINPVKQMIAMAKQVGALTLVDGAQAGPHLAIDVQDLGVDFYTLSCHKMYAPTGVGILYGKLDLLNEMPPYQGGGGMIRSVTFEKTTYAALPDKFEPGTPNIAGFVGYGAALDYIGNLTRIDDGPIGDWTWEDWVRSMNAIADYEQELLIYGTNLLGQVEGLRIIGQAKDKAGILAFDFDTIHPHDVGQILDTYGVAVRVGHHCTQPIMRRYGLAATTRASIGVYNTREDLDRLAGALSKVKEMFA